MSDLDNESSGAALTTASGAPTASPTKSLSPSRPKPSLIRKHAHAPAPRAMRQSTGAISGCPSGQAEFGGGTRSAPAAAQSAERAKPAGIVVAGLIERRD